MILNSRGGFSNYISYIIIIFAAVAAFLLYPRIHPDPVSNNCQIGEPPTEPKEITLPAIKNMDTDGHAPGGPDLLNNSQFELIRVNVPIQNIDSKSPVKIEAIFSNSDHTEKYTQANQPGFDVYYPDSAGEVTLDHNFNSKYEGMTTVFRFRQEGFIFFVHLDQNGNTLVTGDNFYTVDIYQDIRRFQDDSRGYILKDVFKCQGGISGATKIISQTKVYSPSQVPSVDRKQLQLEYFLITPQNSGFNAHCKPAIYLYPPQNLNVNVKVNTKGFLTYTDPPYPDGGWDVLAYPDGKLESRTDNLQLTTYNYLYYESKVPDGLIDVPNNGYTVSFAELPNLYQHVLPKLGLNDIQTKDFVDYWTKALPYSPYYFVGIMDQKNINEFEPLEITPKPDSINRVRVYFKALDKKPTDTVMGDELLVIGNNSNHQSLITNHFHVTEWGGMFKADLLHPFTCSQ